MKLVIDGLHPGRLSIMRNNTQVFCKAVFMNALQLQDVPMKFRMIVRDKKTKGAVEILLRRGQEALFWRNHILIPEAEALVNGLIGKKPYSHRIFYVTIVPQKTP